MPTNTVVKGVRISPPWGAHIEKLLHRNLEERDKSEFIATALLIHVTDWLLRQPQLPPSLLEILYNVASVAVAERDQKRQANIRHAFERLQSVVERLRDDEQLVTILLATVKGLVGTDNKPLDKPFQTAFGTYPVDLLVDDALSGLSLRPADAVETVEPKRVRAKRDGIDPDDFSQPFQDTHGHSIAVSCRIPELLDIAIGKIIDSGIFPYDTASDLLRHAIARRIVLLETQPPLYSVESQATAISRVLREWEVRLGADASFFAALRETVENYTKVGDTEGVYAACIAVKVSVEVMPDSLWKERRQRLFEAEFGHLLAGRGIDLNPNHS